MSEKKQARPATTPIPVRFPVKMVKEIQELSKDMEMPQQEVIRLSVSAGLKALKRMGYDGLAEKIADELEKD